jgi:hypothetical protein
MEAKAFPGAALLALGAASEDADSSGFSGVCIFQQYHDSTQWLRSGYGFVKFSQYR